MARWVEVEQEQPGLAGRARELLTARTHLVLATLRSDGSPRASGTELVVQDGDLWLAGMPGSLKLRDLRRDARFALHSGSEDPPAWRGDAKVAGRAVEVVDEAALAAFLPEGEEAPGGSFELFRLDLTEVVVVRLGEPADHLVIESWHEGRGTTTVERR